MTPVLQLTRRGAVWHDDPARALPRLRDEFRERHAVRLPSLIEPALLAMIQRQIADAAFLNRYDDPIAAELTMEVNACTGILQFLVNDPALYTLVEEVAGDRPIRLFNGRIYRVVRELRRDPKWHDDVSDGRLSAMSVNLGAEPYDGGVLELRRRDADAAFASLPNVVPGDAILFRVADGFEHRVTNVRGDVPKTAFAGWFKHGPAYVAK